ncbi:MAG: tetratricopeptide repeat protein [Prevotellaceae bacterium]|nr:tetratricopeptide repeat protein [Prevotellaceae bacterium]
MDTNTNKTATQPQENAGIAAKIKNNPVISAIVGIFVLAALVFIGAHLYNKYIDNQNNEAATKLAKGQEYFAQGNFDQALNGDNAGYPGLVKIASQYSSTRTGNVANLYAGLAYYYKADYDNAIKYLDEYDPQDDSFISNNAIAALGNCYAKKGNINKAVDLLKKAANRADNPIVSPYCLVQAGELLESQNKPDEAVKLYKEVKNKYPQSGEAQYIDKYIDRASK